MQNRLVRKGLVVGIIGILVFVAVAPGISATLSFEDDKVLTKQHIPYLLLGLVTVNNAEIKLILKDVIWEIIQSDDATFDEVKNVVKSNSKQIEADYILARIKTTERTNGYAFCTPGFIRSTSYGAIFEEIKYIAKGIFVEYGTHEVKSDWHLTVNGQLVDEIDKGYIIGYFGMASYMFYEQPPASWANFRLNGIGLIVLHGVE